jgi:hypothetical protein
MYILAYYAYLRDIFLSLPKAKSYNDTSYILCIDAGDLLRCRGGQFMECNLSGRLDILLCIAYRLTSPEKTTEKFDFELE